MACYGAVSLEAWVFDPPCLTAKNVAVFREEQNVNALSLLPSTQSGIGMADWQRKQFRQLFAKTYLPAVSEGVKKLCFRSRPETAVPSP